jgi:hypothetical protein
MEQPLFSLMNNEVVSRNIFKDQLQVCLEYVGHSIKNNKSHSFRIGAATTAWANGFSEEQIQQMGRASFKHYCLAEALIPMLSILCSHRLLS